MSGKYRGSVHLLAVVVLLPLLAWRLALATTFSDWREAKRTEREVAMMCENGASPVTAAKLGTAEHIGDGEVLGDILCGPGACDVVSYTPYFASAEGGVTLHTAEIVLNTDYASCVRIVDNIERTMPTSRLRSLTMRSVTPRGSSQVLLHATLVIQQLTDAGASRHSDINETSE